MEISLVTVNGPWRTLCITMTRGMEEIRVVVSRFFRILSLEGEERRSLGEERSTPFRIFLFPGKRVSWWKEGGW